MELKWRSVPLPTFVPPLLVLMLSTKQLQSHTHHVLPLQCRNTRTILNSYTSKERKYRKKKTSRRRWPSLHIVPHAISYQRRCSLSQKFVLCQVHSPSASVPLTSLREGRLCPREKPSWGVFAGRLCLTEKPSWGLSMHEGWKSSEQLMNVAATGDAVPKSLHETGDGKHQEMDFIHYIWMKVYVIVTHLRE